MKNRLLGVDEKWTDNIDMLERAYPDLLAVLREKFP
jgi:hypothetical protein